VKPQTGSPGQCNRQAISCVNIDRSSGSVRVPLQNTLFCLRRGISQFHMKMSVRHFHFERGVMEDNKIVDLYWERNEEAIAETINAYGRYCRTIAFNILGVEEDVQECLNDTWMNAWNGIPPARPACLSAFLGKITRNLAISRYRAGHAVKRTGDRLSESLDELGDFLTPASNNVEEAVDRRALEEAINSYLDTVTEKQRRLFVRRYFYMDSISEIAGMYGIGQSDVKVTLLRMRRSLQKVLEKEGLI